MQLTELLRAIRAVVETGASARQCEQLAIETGRLADMVGWASGPIDPDGEWLGRIAGLQDDLLRRHAESGDDAQVMLHDALTVLGRAILRHDEDLEARRTGTEDDEDLN